MSDKIWSPFEAKEDIKFEAPAEESKETSSEKIIDYIKKNDQGDGVDVSEIFKMENGERIINTLLEVGEVFEVKPGKIKVLE